MITVADDDYLAGLRELAEAIRAQGEELRRGRLAAAGRENRRAADIMERLSSLRPEDPEAVAHAARELRAVLAAVEAQLAAVTVFREEAARELAEAGRWRRRLADYRRSCPGREEHLIDFRG